MYEIPGWRPAGSTLPHGQDWVFSFGLATVLELVSQ